MIITALFVAIFIDFIFNIYIWETYRLFSMTHYFFIKEDDDMLSSVSRLFDI